jgi:serine/threonine protein kinase
MLVNKTEYSFGSSAFGQIKDADFSVTLRTVLEKTCSPYSLIQVPYSTAAKLEPSDAETVDCTQVGLLNQIADELVVQVCQRCDNESPEHVHEMLSKIPFKDSELSLLLEKSFIYAVLMKHDRAAKMMLGSLLTRIPHSVFERDMILEEGRKNFLDYFKVLVQQEVVEDREHFRVALEIVVNISPHTQWFAFSIFHEKFSNESAEIFVECLDDLIAQDNFRAISLVPDVMGIYHMLPVVAGQGIEKVSVLDRLRISYFYYFKGQNFTEHDLSLVAEALATIPPSLDCHIVRHLYESYFKAVEALLFSLPFPQSLLTYIKFISYFHKACCLQSHVLKGLSQKLAATIFQDDFFEELKECINSKDVRTFTGLTENGVAYLRHILGWKLDSLRESGSVDDSFALLNKTYKRLDQLMRAPLSEFEDPQPDTEELFKVAFFIETAVKEMAPFSKRYFSKKETHLNRAIRIDLTRACVGISAKPLISTLNEKGWFKKVINILKIWLNNFSLTPVVKARAISRKRSTEEDIENLRNEIARMKLYEDDRHVMHLEDSYEHLVTNGDGVAVSLPRISMELPKFEHNGWQMVTNKVELTLPEKVQLFRDLIEGVSAFHKKGCIHGDIRPYNFVFTNKAIGNSSISGSVCDLGSVTQAIAFKMLPEGHMACQYSFGYYGSVVYTSPELFGVINFAGDHYQNEVFAIGITLHEMLYGCAPKWTTIILEAYQDFDTQTFTYKEKFKDLAALCPVQDKVKLLVKQEIDESEEFKELCKKKREKKITQEEDMKLLIYSMLRFDPKDRITLARARLEIRKIFISYPPIKALKQKNEE